MAAPAEELETAEELNRRLAPFKGNPFAKAGIEMAWWSLEAQIRGRPLHQLLGGTRRVVEAGADFGIRGDGENARKSYTEAEAVLAGTRTHIERTAWQGAHSRSTEQFLKSGELDRAAKQLRAWQDEFPADKIDGYLNLMLARFWAGRGEHAQAVALAEALLAVNPESPHVDQLLVVAADCEVKRGQVDRALAFLNQLLKDYPGSPLVPAVREKVAKLEAGKAKVPKTPAPKAVPSRSE